MDLYGIGDIERQIAIRGGVERDWRGQFRRDYARLVHCPSFRRLQGKTQLLSGLESDYFRNRLTHSLEVAQVAKSIALKLNVEHLKNEDCALDLDLVEFAGLAHDLGHAPFGHTGERVLNDIMRHHGGFEGNAQTLRILSRLEKKLDDPDTQIDQSGSEHWWDGGKEASHGLNLCSRTLASILKYDHEIPDNVPNDVLVKGYYRSERALVQKIKRAVAPNYKGKLKTLECQIMDIADDIAYSTYDIEDSFKAGFSTFLDIINPDDAALLDITQRAQKGLADPKFEPEDALKALRRALPYDMLNEKYPQVLIQARVYAENGYFRNALTSHLIRKFVDGVRFSLDKKYPALSRVHLDPQIHEEVEVLKHFTFVRMIKSNRLRIVATRAEFIVRTILDVLQTPGGCSLLPTDFRNRYMQAAGTDDIVSHKASTSAPCMRVLCDFVAGMTDRYAVEFYSRLRSETYQTLFRNY